VTEDSVGDLGLQAEEFGEETASLLRNVLPDAPPIAVIQSGNHYVIRPGTENKKSGIPLSINGERLATLDIFVACKLDSFRAHLAVDSSSFTLSADVDRTPILRFEYERDMNKAPHAHVHVHAHRGALSHLLSQAGNVDAHDMSSMHIPVGGSRLRPCLEDMIQFLIVECGFSAHEGWRENLERGRELWRRRQLSAMVRAVPSEAVRVLSGMGYKLEPPADIPEDSQKALWLW
jgi:hypothetical protein